MSSTPVTFVPRTPTGEPLRLAMQRLWLTGSILPAGARLIVQHVFRSSEDQPLEIIYSFQLPRDAALRSFRIVGDGFEAHSELRATGEAVKAYEQGIAQGSLSTLARQYGDGVVNLTIGNIRPNETVTVYLEILAGVDMSDDGFRFRFPFTLAPAYHPRMKAARVAEGEGELELPPAEFGDVILPRFREDASSLHEVGFDLTVSHQLSIGEIASPSHSIRLSQKETTRITLSPEKDVPNRDLVLDVGFQEAAAQVLAGPDGDGRRCFAAIVPSRLFGAASNAPRRIVILLDRSGSMQGAPIEQACKSIKACLGALGEDDSFGIVAFNSQVQSMASSLLSAATENREKARAFLHSVQAGGGTELAAGFTEAARLLDGSGDVLIFTDGQVAGTEQILAQARALQIRLFCLGIGSASQDRFLALLSRETGGISRFVTPRERVDLPAVDLFAAIGRPVASSLKTTPAVQPQPPSAVFAGTPVLLFGEVPGEVENEAPTLELSWDTGQMSLPIPPGDAQTGTIVRLLQGSRLITDWESRYPGEQALAALERRQQNRIASRLVELSQRYGLASREMSLVAVVERAGDRPGELPQTRVVPVGIPQDVQAAAYFAPPPPPPLAYAASSEQVPLARPNYALPSSGANSPVGRRRFQFDQLRSLFHKSPSAASPEPPSKSTTDLLLELAAQLQPDGGMPGNNTDARLLRSLAATLAFVSEGHTTTQGAFRTHVVRLLKFLESLPGLDERSKNAVERASRAALSGQAPPGNWLAIARSSNPVWQNIERVLAAGAHG